MRVVRSIPILDVFEGKTSKADFNRRDEGCGGKESNQNITARIRPEKITTQEILG